MKYRYLVIGPDPNGGEQVRFAKDWDAVNGIFAGTKDYNPIWDGKQRFLKEGDVQKDDEGTGYAMLDWDKDGTAKVMVLEIKAIVIPKPKQFVTKFEP